MDEETLVEALKEIILGGEYAWKADELLEEEMKSNGYSDSELRIVREIAKANIGGQDAASLARRLVSVFDKGDATLFVR